MPLSSAPVTFFLATKQAEEAKFFYENILGLALLEDSQYALVFEMLGAELRISKVPGFEPFPWTVLDWQVGDLDATMKELAEKGIEFTRFDGMDQDENGVWTVPGGETRIAWFKDPDANVLSVSHRG